MYNNFKINHLINKIFLNKWHLIDKKKKIIRNKYNLMYNCLHIMKFFS